MATSPLPLSRREPLPNVHGDQASIPHSDQPALRGHRKSGGAYEGAARPIQPAEFGGPGSCATPHPPLVWRQPALSSRILLRLAWHGSSALRPTMHGGPSGFHNAPVSRTVMIASGVLSIIFGVRGRYLRLGLSYQEIFKQFRLGRFIASQFAFSSTPELMFGLYLIYYFRIFERQIGSNKYSVFILFSMFVTTLFEVLALVLLKDSTNLLASGPYSLIFASFVLFHLDIPVSSRFHLFGINFTDKSFIYLAGLQLLLSSWKRSVIPGICGLLAGFLYRINAFHVRRIKLPEFMASFFGRLSWSSGSSSRTTSSRNVVGNFPQNGGRRVERSYAPVARSTVLEPPEDSIATLVSMGFDSNSARQALMRARNDINVATNILLESQSG